MPNKNVCDYIHFMNIFFFFKAVFGVRVNGIIHAISPFLSILQSYLGVFLLPLLTQPPTPQPQYPQHDTLLCSCLSEEPVTLDYL